MNDRMSHLTTIVSFLAGGIAGATAALLLAPQSGRDTRQAIARKASDTADSAREMKDRVLQKGGEMWGEATHRVDGAASALLGGDGHKPDGTPEPLPSNL
jgi:gas vesicle protein